MNKLIGTILSGSTGGESATFEVIDVLTDGNDVYAIAQCVEFGMPHQKIHIDFINNPVRA